MVQTAAIEASILGAAFGYLIKMAIGTAYPRLLAFIVIPVYGAVYFGGAMLLGIDEARTTLLPLTRIWKRVSP